MKVVIFWTGVEHEKCIKKLHPSGYGISFSNIGD